MFNVRVLTEADYEMLAGWWKAWRWTPPPQDFLPQNGAGGLMIEKEGICIVAGFIYFTNSAVAWSEFIISNFDFKDKVEREQAIDILISELTRIAGERGAKYIYTVVKNQNLKNRYQKMGYQVGSQKVDEMFMILS